MSCICNDNAIWPLPVLDFARIHHDTRKLR